MFEDDDLPKDQDIEQPDVETTDDLPDDEPNDEPQDSQDDDDLGFSFDEPENDSEGHDPFAGQAAPEWVKQLRKENRELKKQLKQTPQQPQVAQLREKPTITDHDFDSEAYEADLEQWFNEKAQYDEVINAQKAKDKAIDNRYHVSVDKMRKIAADYDEVEDIVVATLSPEKQALLKMQGMAQQSQTMQAMLSILQGMAQGQAQQNEQIKTEVNGNGEQVPPELLAQMQQQIGNQVPPELLAQMQQQIGNQVPQT